MVEVDRSGLNITRQVELLSIPRSSFNYIPVGESAQNLEIMRLLDEQVYVNSGLRRIPSSRIVSIGRILS